MLGVFCLFVFEWICLIKEQFLVQGWRHEVFLCFVMENESYYREGNIEGRRDGWGEREKNRGWRKVGEKEARKFRRGTRLQPDWWREGIKQINSNLLLKSMFCAWSMCRPPHEVSGCASLGCQKKFVVWNSNPGLLGVAGRGIWLWLWDEFDITVQSNWRWWRHVWGVIVHGFTPSPSAHGKVYQVNYCDQVI